VISLKSKSGRLRSSAEYRELKQEKDLFRRRLYFLAFFADKLKAAGVDAILVGGEAIDLYTGGTFATSDCDLLVSNKMETEKLLNKLGFGKEDNQLWFNQELNIVIQVITAMYSGETPKLRTFKVKGFELKVAAPEDLIASRLYSAKFSKSSPQRDFEQAVALLKIFSDSLDNKYLSRLAKRSDIVDFLAKARSYASKL
jgi:hypothetical protein